MPAKKPAPTAFPLDLALQGGGSHGAFTWGVLDRLLDEADLRFDGVSGTSAGALNAAVLATGLAEGGRGAAGCLFRRVAAQPRQRTGRLQSRQQPLLCRRTPDPARLQPGTVQPAG